MRTKKEITERIEKLERTLIEYEATTKYVYCIEGIQEEIITLKWVLS